MITIALASWNDLEYLKILIKSIKRNTKIRHEIIVHDNGSIDGTEAWLKSNNIKYTRTPENVGVGGVNYAVNEAKYPFIVDINADMYVLPYWDVALYSQINKFQKQGKDKFTISSCLIEPNGNNPEYSIRYHGDTPESFDEEKLISDYQTNLHHSPKKDTTQYSHPITMPKTLWDSFGGVDLGYKYGIATDHDIAASAYSKGCRDFIMLGNSRVYHFISKTIRKLPADRPTGEQFFFDKWKISISDFRNKLEIAKDYKTVKEKIL